ncbi:hypothetical protein GQ457_05G021930 [Hibiscus cannabinus]
MKSGPRVAPTREQLDRFITDKDWFLSFPTFRAWSEYNLNSDHHFILLDTVAPSIAPEARGRDPIFHFDDCWAREPECISMVQALWAHSTGSFADRLSTICDGLRQWQCAKRATDWERIPRLRSEINRLSSRRLNPEDLEVLLTTKGELRHLLNVQEVYWAECSRVLWLSAGDRNNSFFHAKASARKKKNALIGLYDANGYWQTSTREVLRIASDYFVILFSASPPVETPTFLEHIPPSVTKDVNSGLLAAFTADEVIAAFRDINPRKSPGIDGLPSGFFRQNWDILGEDFVSLCLDILCGHVDMASVNETVIVLIPKVDKPTSMRQLRPISLCTAIYKTVSKSIFLRTTHSSTPTPAGSVKINVDGAFLPSARLDAIGVIGRDSSGAVLGGFAKPVPVHGPASTMEVSALFVGLEFAIPNGWPLALIESDVAVLVNKLHRPTVDLSLLGDLLAPSRALLAASNGCLRVGFASRSANSAAHALASWACHNDNVISFSLVCPELISCIVLDDLSSSF